MLHIKNDNYTIYRASCLDVMDSMEENSIDCIVTDPPYEIGFMNKGWDNTGIAFNIETWQKALRVLKPGGYLLAFNHSRTFHRMMVAIEDAGFELRDTIMWLYGSGFPKSHNVGLSIDKKLGHPDRGHRIAVANRNHPDGTLEPNGEFLEPYKTKSKEAHKWNGWGTALKPAFEPIVVARKPFKGSVAENILRYGVGGINIDECRVDAIQGEYDIRHYTNEDCFQNTKQKESKFQVKEQPAGRFPANIIHDGSEEACSGFPETSPSIQNKQSDNRKVGYYDVAGQKNGGISGEHNPQNSYSDNGSASRYFYTAKASVKDRDDGLDEFVSKFTAAAEFRPNHMEKALEGDDGNPYGRWQPRKNIHPTVKPTDLMQYLVRLVAPKGATVMDIFMGSGSTGKACMIENVERDANYHFIGIDLDSDEQGNPLGYCDIAQARIEWGLHFKEIAEAEAEQSILYDDDGTIKVVKQEKLF